MTMTMPLKGNEPEQREEHISNAAVGDVITPSANNSRSSTYRSSFNSKSQRRTGRAISDAQASLDALLNPSKQDTSGPVVLSPSGKTRTTRHRVAGPKASRTASEIALHIGEDGSVRQLGGEKNTGGASTQLSLRHSSLAIFDAAEDDEDELSFFHKPKSTIENHLAIARGHAGALIHAIEDPSSVTAAETETLQASRRAASRWVSRHATPLVILLVVFTLAASGGIKAIAGQRTGGSALAAGAVGGTDHFDDGDDAYPVYGKAAADSNDYEIPLPRTALGPSGTAPAPVVGLPAAPAAAGKDQALATSAGDVIKYTVAAGDTIDGVANKYNVMPETIMGSNGIFDSEVDLSVGSTLIIPPLDGMYYVAAKGDTLESVAQRFQVEPSLITAYPGNHLHNGGQVAAGQTIIVPGGMMPARETTITYTVRQGDTLKRIAARFEVDVPTIIYSNDIPDADNLKIGSQLRLLPVPGMEYKVKRGDTIESIAARLNVAPQMILDYTPNNVSLDKPLQIDQVIMVPGGSPEEQTVAAVRIEPSARGAARPPDKPANQPEPQRPTKSQDAQAPRQPAAQKSDSNPAAKKSDTTVSADKPAAKKSEDTAAKPAAKKSDTSSEAVRVGTGRLVWPVSGVITQYFSRRHNGLDIATSAGTPLHAADSGEVIWAGWRRDGLGYCVMIDHHNGLVTVYGHMIRQPAVFVGQYVGRGQRIGYVGSTGHSTGPHVHFMVKNGGNHNYRNPLGYLP